MATDATDLMTRIFQDHASQVTGLFGGLVPKEGSPEAESAVHWAEIAGRMHSIWTDFQVEQLGKAKDGTGHWSDPVKWVATAEAVVRQLPLADPDVQQRLWNEAAQLINGVLGQYGLGPAAAAAGQKQPAAFPAAP